MKNILNTIRVFSLQEEFKYLLEHNKSNNIPYHNLRHTLTVFKNCRDAAFSEGMLIHEIKDLLVAALFHDFNHSGGILTDEENVKEAFIAFEVFASMTGERYTLGRFNKIIEIIKATQYPYVIPKEELNLSQMIIRDADLCQMFEDDWLSQVFYGLCAEMGVKDKKESIAKFRDFFINITLNTEWGIQRKLTHSYDYLQNLNRLELLLS